MIDKEQKRGDKMIQACDLRCEYLTSPVLGLDVIPRFSWRLKGNGKKQTRYKIIVSDNFDDIERGIGNVWESEKDSSKNLNIEYEGPKLKAYKGYYWRVKLWDEKEEGPWSVTGYFEMGPLGDWKGKWITMPSPLSFKDPAHRHELFYAMYFRKEFLLNKEIEKARVYVSGLGVYELYLNGRRVGNNVLDPASTDYNKVALYSTYDVTQYLTTGKNSIGVILGNGRHIRDYGYSKPKLYLQLFVFYKDGSLEFICSDETWKVSHGPLRENGIYFGEVYDARNEISGWDLPGFDDENWSEVEIVEGPPLKAQLIPVMRVCEVIKPKRLWLSSRGTFIVDFGKNISGWVKLRVNNGKKGEKIIVRYAEVLDPSMDQLDMRNLRLARATDEYILKGQGVEIYEPRFTYHGFRYVEVEDYPGTLTSDDIEAMFVHTDVEKIGNFACSSELLNKIHSCVVNSQLANLMGIPTDCPQRDERMGWLGDAQLTVEEAMYNFDMAAFYTKYLMDIKLSQKEDGSISDVAPPYWKRYPSDPAWGTAYATILWYLYFFYEDRRVLEEHYDSLKRYVEFLRKNSPNHLTKLGQHGDWCPPGDKFPKRTPLILTSTWYYYHDTLILSEIAKILGKKEDEHEYRKLAGEIKEAFNRHFLRKVEDHTGRIVCFYRGIKLSPKDRIPTTQTCNVLPLWNKMVPEECREDVFKVLERLIEVDNDTHFDTGIVGTRYILEVLSENGRKDLALKLLLKEDYPSFGYMIRNGATTLWERWEKLEGIGMNSHNHVMLGSVDTWFYKYLAGIKPVAPGWKRVRIEPYFPNQIDFVLARINTPKGLLEISWKKQGEKYEVQVTISPNMVGTFVAPDGFKVSAVNNKQVDHRSTFEIEAGVYNIILERVREC
jgi:alpha-L-rhamnosidase